MITIEHINGDKKVVTKGAFESIFKPLGYKLKSVEPKKVTGEEKVVKKEDVEINNETSENYKSIDKDNRRK